MSRGSNWTTASGARELKANSYSNPTQPKEPRRLVRDSVSVCSATLYKDVVASARISFTKSTRKQKDTKLAELLRCQNEN